MYNLEILFDSIKFSSIVISLEKKEKIIKAGFNLMCKKGYYNTNTVEIAKFAGVSTGIVYHKHPQMDYDVMTNLVISSIEDLLNA